MALLFFDGCGEYYDTAHLEQVWDGSSSGPSVGLVGRRGGAGITCASLDSMDKIIPITTGSVFCGFAIEFTSVVQDVFFHIFRESSVHINLELEANGAITINYGPSSSQTSSSGLVSPGVYHYLEIQALVDDSVGLYTVKLDGIQILTNSSVDTQNGGLAGIDRIRFGDTGAHTTLRFDDVYILDTTGTPAAQKTFLGDIRVDAVFPDGDGTQTQFDTTFPASPTTHYTKVDENPATADTDYNETATVNDTDLFDYAALPSVAGGSTVLSVKVAALARKTDAGSRTLQLVTRPVSTNFNSGDKALQTDYHYKFELWDEDPQAAAAWTDSTINAAEFGVEAT